jgi:NADH dehydrogenase
MSDVIVIGSGFAGLWAALGAARRLDELMVPDRRATVTVLSSVPYHDIRVRNYEGDLSACRIPLSAVLDPAGVRHVTATVTAIDPVAHTVTAGGRVFQYDRLVLAAGSRVARPEIPGLSDFGFDVDTYDAALQLDAHLRRLAVGPMLPADATVVVVGAGLTGIETACELPDRIRTVFGPAVRPRVVLVDHNPRVGSDMGDSARPVIEDALVRNGVETRTGCGVVAVDRDAVTLDSGEVIPSTTLVWCAGMRANPLTKQLPVPRDRLGRVTVDDYLRVVGVADVFAAGDVASAQMDDEHLSVMSCQHSRPMGRFAGYNVISDLMGEPMLGLRIPWYVTVLDLGPSDAVYTEGWDRQVAATGVTAKATKMTINRERIYPPLSASGDAERTALLAAAAPQLQGRP